MSLDHLQAFFSEGNNQNIQEHQEEETSKPKPILTRQIEANKQSIARYKEMTNNIKNSEKLRAEITKGIKNNASTDDLLLTAIECIGLMTGDKVFSKQNIDVLKGRSKRN